MNNEFSVACLNELCDLRVLSLSLVRPLEHFLSFYCTGTAYSIDKLLYIFSASNTALIVHLTYLCYLILTVYKYLMLSDFSKLMFKTQIICCKIGTNCLSLL